MCHVMQRMIRVAAALVLACLLNGGSAFAEDAHPDAKPEAQQEAPKDAKEAHEEPIKQIKLTEEQVKNFISAQPDLGTVAGKLQQAGNDPDAALRAELDGIAKKH